MGTETAGQVFLNWVTEILWAVQVLLSRMRMKKKQPSPVMHFCLQGFHLVLKRHLWRDLRLNRCLSHSRISFSYLCPASWYFTVPTVSPFLRQRVALLGLFFIPCLLLLLLIMDLGHRGTSSARDRQYERWVSFASLWLACCWGYQLPSGLGAVPGSWACGKHSPTKLWPHPPISFWLSRQGSH